MKKLSIKDLILLILTNFALYVGAGNIIFPPYIGMLSGSEVLTSGLGFLITGVGLPVIAAIALARVCGSLNAITSPLGIKIGIAMIVICYLAIGPFYAIPRTATVAFELSIRPLLSKNYLLIFTILYFITVFFIALYPTKLLDIVGKILSPIKIGALFILCISAIFIMPSDPIEGFEPYKTAPFAQGIINGYLTLDTLASLAFGTVIVSAIRSRNVTDRKSITKYAAISGCLAGLGMIFVYVCLFKLGNHSYQIASHAQNGAEVLTAFINYSFGAKGTIFLAIVILFACLVTAIGLTCACSTYFAKITGVNYRIYVFIITVVSALIANLGLTSLIQVSVPVLITLYPAFIILVIASFFTDKMKKPHYVIAPTAVLALIFGVIDGFDAAGITLLPTSISAKIPFFNADLAWVLPCLVLSIILFIICHLKFKE